MIVLISSGQPSLNPRLIKEADALAATGLEFVVIYQFWNDWGTKYDEELLKQKKWKCIRVGGSSKDQKLSWFKTRIRQKIALFLASKLGFDYGIAEKAIGRCTTELAQKAMTIPADLYIAHNLAALPAAYWAARKNKSKYGFDAEDFHRNEVSDNPNALDVKLKTFIEDKYLPKINYFTTSSPFISNSYQQIFQSLSPLTILNVFPIQHIIIETNVSISMKLFWFSQTIGKNRGIETVIQAMGSSKVKNIELHLLGAHDQHIKSTFIDHAKESGFDYKKIYYYAPIPPDDIYNFAKQFDIGLATEISFPKNRDMCLTNKIFTYIQSGLAVIASSTTAQKDLMNTYPNMGKLYDDPLQLTNILEVYANDPELLLKHKNQALTYGETQLSWEFEKNKFLKLVNQTIRF